MLKMCVSRHNKTYYKFWWNEELSVLKKDAVETNKICGAGGKSHSGLIFNNRQQIQKQKKVWECEQQPTLSYANDLHKALLHKNGVAFWTCCPAKFESTSKRVEVDQCVRLVAVYLETHCNIGSKTVFPTGAFDR